jgi:hypothetical protein
MKIKTLKIHGVKALATLIFRIVDTIHWDLGLVFSSL